MKRAGAIALSIILALGMAPCAWAQEGEGPDAAAAVEKGGVGASSVQGDQPKDNQAAPDAPEGGQAAPDASKPLVPSEEAEPADRPADAVDSAAPDVPPSSSPAASAPAAGPSPVAPQPAEGAAGAGEGPKAQAEAPEHLKASSPVTATLSKDQRVATVRLDPVAAKGATAVLFPTWSVTGGQDDIVWYVAKRASDGSWSATIPIAAHGSAGAYSAHAYVTAGGRQHYAGEASFEVSPPQATVSLTQSDAQRRAGLFSVTVSGVSAPAGVTRVQVPVWSEAGGQDDIEWLEAKNRGNGVWSVEASLSHPRRAAGTYLAHAYVTCGNGVFSYAGQAAGQVTLFPTTIKATVSSDQKSATVEASGGWLSTATSVLFPVWSVAGGQDDIRWYAGSRGVDGVWRLKVPIASHGDAGAYAVHVYATVRGAQRYAAETTFDVAGPSASVSLSQTDAQKRAGTFTVTVSGIKSPSGVSSVSVPVWSVAGGQDDIVWYSATRKADGSWAATVPLAHPRRNVGDYAAHAYVTMGNGVFGYAGETVGAVSVLPASVSASLSKDQKTITVTASGGWFAMAPSVVFPVWSTAGGQDDIIWYYGRKGPDGTWTASIPVSSHGDAGSYAVHAYASVGGSLRFGGESAVTVAAPTARSVTASKNDGAGTITVTVSGITSASGVSRVHIPTWTSAGGQDDIVWYEAARQPDGSYRVTIPAYRHNGEPGTYLAHAYVTGGNGVRSCVGTTSATLNLTNYVFVTGGSGSRTVWVRNPSGSPSSVQVPTWSEAGGQDDIVWYGARHVGGGLWRADINCKNFAHAGRCVSHVYSNGSFVGMASFSVSSSEIIPPKYQAMNNRVASLSSPTGYLIAIDNVNCFIGIYKGSRGNWTNIAFWSCGPGAPRTPTVKGLYSVGSRGYVFGSGYSCYYWTQFYGNYLFHSVLYNQGTRVIQDGTLGRQVSHGCVRLNIDHAKWIYDNIPSRTTVLSY